MADPVTIHHVVHAVKHVHHITPIIHTGYSLTSLIISNLISAAIAAGLSWYVRGRGYTGVQTDLANAQAEITKIKTETSTAVQAVA